MGKRPVVVLKLQYNTPRHITPADRDALKRVARARFATGESFVVGSALTITQNIHCCALLNGYEATFLGVVPGVEAPSWTGQLLNFGTLPDFVVVQVDSETARRVSTFAVPGPQNKGIHVALIPPSTQNPPLNTEQKKFVAKFGGSVSHIPVRNAIAACISGKQGGTYDAIAPVLFNNHEASVFKRSEYVKFTRGTSPEKIRGLFLDNATNMPINDFDIWHRRWLKLEINDDAIAAGIELENWIHSSRDSNSADGRHTTVGIDVGPWESLAKSIFTKRREQPEPPPKGKRGQDASVRRAKRK